MKTLAVLASMPGRPLATVLESLAPQVDQLAVWLNGYPTIPACVRDLGARCWVVRSDENRGAEVKFAWARSWDGLYIACDDDLEYPPDYALVMRKAVEAERGRALVTLHGRVFYGRAAWGNWLWAGACLEDWPADAWVNYGGTGVMAFHTGLGVPSVWPGRNCADAQVAVWAQRHRVPIRLLAHRGDWLRYLLAPGARTIYEAERTSGFAAKNAILAQHRDWGVLTTTEAMAA